MEFRKFKFISKKIRLDLPINVWAKKDGVTEKEFKKFIKEAAEKKITKKVDILN